MTQNPFASIDQAGVGQLVKIAAKKGTHTRPVTGADLSEPAITAIIMAGLALGVAGLRRRRKSKAA